jgi:surface antigen/peptidoglycan hydrolase CwlO-like protein
MVYSITQNKNMQKHKTKSNTILRASRRGLIAFVLSLSVLGFGLTHLVGADNYSAQIQTLQSANAAAASSVSQLEAQAGSYQAAISRLDSQISIVQGQIDASQAALQQLQTEITQDEATEVQDKGVLSDDLKTMYVEGQMTTIEELATSSSLSAYVDKEEYQTAVQNKIDDLLHQIQALEIQQQAQKVQSQELLTAQQTQQSQLSADQSQQQQLLGLTQSQQSQLNQQIQTNNSQISQLQAEQAAALRALEGGGETYGGNGSYPWSNAPCLGPGGGATCGNYNWGYPDGTGVPLGAPSGYYDPWGYEYRNCTSYVAWKIANTSTSSAINDLISGLGNASNWPSAAAREGLPVSYGSNPQVGDAAVDPGGGGWQGHVMYVEAVNGDGSIDVSQYNAGENGTYSTATISASEVTTLDFIAFPGS